jgi:microcystin-dependent protein
MAGAGIKIFQSGEKLTAAQVNAYLMDQVIARFPDAATRDAAFGGSGRPELTEGRFCYLDDLNEVQYFDGSVWQSAPQFAIEDNAVTTAKIANGAVTSAKIADGAIVNADISPSAEIAKTKISGTAITTTDTGTVTSTMIADETILNSDISTTAAIDKTKISGTAITAADTGTVTSTMIANGTIVNADISASAAIDKAKISGTAITTADTGTVTSTMIANGAVTTEKLGNDVQFLPAGLIAPFGGSSAPTGWLLCHGQAVSRSTYSALFAVFSTTYGAGNGSTTFNLPDLRGRVIAGVDNMGGTAANRLTSTTITGGGDAPGEVGGAQTHLLTGAESGTSAHGHTASSGSAGTHNHSASSNTAGAHVHTQTGHPDPGGTGARDAFNGLNLPQSVTGSAGDHSHTITVNDGGAHTHTVTVTNSTAANASSAHNNVQPTMVLNYIVKF